MKKLYFVIAIMVAILLGSLDMKAQGTCLCSSVAPSTPPWGGYTCDWIMVTMPNSAVCSTYVCWCTRTLGDGTVQYCINGGGCSPGCYDLEANPTEADDYFRRIGLDLIKAKYNPSPCPPCGSAPAVVVEVINSSCMRIEDDTVHQISNLVKCNDDGYCKRVYNVCCTPVGGAKVVTYISTESIGESCTGSDYEAGCFPICD
jgi:hypothetical protein